MPETPDNLIAEKLEHSICELATMVPWLEAMAQGFASCKTTGPASPARLMHAEFMGVRRLAASCERVQMLALRVLDSGGEPELPHGLTCKETPGVEDRLWLAAKMMAGLSWLLDTAFDAESVAEVASTSDADMEEFRRENQTLLSNYKLVREAAAELAGVMSRLLIAYRVETE